MADTISFIPDNGDISALTPQQLRDYRSQVLAQIARLDAKEPKNMNSEAYEAWGDAHEQLEDLLDDIQDRLEELGE